MGPLFLLFTLVPMLELYLLVRVGGIIGPANTLLLVLFTGFLGAWLARSQGARVLSEWQQALADNRMPTEGVLSGLLVLVGGVLLITPGIFTDLVGFWLLMPFTRQAASRLLRNWVQRQMDSGRIQVNTGDASPFGAGPMPPGGPFGVAGNPRQGADPTQRPTSERPRPQRPRPQRPRPPMNGDVIDTSGEDVSGD